MKKILLLLFLAYSYSFSWSTYECGANLSFINSGPVLSGPYWTPYEGCQRNYFNNDVTVTYGGLAWSISLYSGTGSPACNSTLEMSDGIMTCTEDNKLGEFIPNPDPNGGSTCRELFEKDGVYHVCNPNTNESRAEPDLELVEDANGQITPGCKNGKQYGSEWVIGSNSDGSSFTPYTDRTCFTPTDVDNPNGTGENPNTFPDAPTTSTGADGSTTWTWGDGTTQTLSPNGTLTTTYPDGTISVKQTGNDYDPTTGGSSGGTATGGTGGAGTNGNTTNETDTPNNNDTPIDETPVANSCNDSSLTLQEKMLCEMNAGMKKLNSEGSPSNSLNNLINEMNKDNNNTNTTAINTNIKDTNKILTDTKSLNENQLSELKNVTKELKKLNASTGTTSSTTTPSQEPTTADAEGFVNGLDTFINDSKNFEELKEATSEVTGFLSGKFDDYSNSLKSQLLGLFSSFFNIQTTGLPPIGIPYNFYAFGRNFSGVFLDSIMFEKLGLDKLSIIVIFLFSLMGFIHAFRFLMNSSSPVTTKDK